MKKFVSILLVAMLTVLLASSALAEFSYNESTGKLTGSCSGATEIWVNGEPAGRDSISMSVTPGTYNIECFVDGARKDTHTVVVSAPATEPPATEEPTATPEPTAEPTAEPTPTPVITEAPKTEAPKTEAPKTEAPKTEAPKTTAPTTAPTKAPSTDNDDVPKTGDATTTFVFVIVAAMLLAAGALTAMRVYARKK